MLVDLSTAEVATLRERLDRDVREMSSQIADTDNPKFRTQLREERDTLRSIRDRLSQETVPGP
jgi:hypothetical protein